MQQDSRQAQKLMPGLHNLLIERVLGMPPCVRPKTLSVSSKLCEIKAVTLTKICTCRPRKRGEDAMDVDENSGADEE